MFLTPNIDELREILELFYNLSGIRIVLFDDLFNEIIAYPSDKCVFCREIRSRADLAAKCTASDLQAFDACRKSGDIIIYKCHAGLTEATLPLSHSGRIIGYVMFGQITDIKEKDKLREFVIEFNKKYGTECSAKGIKHRSEKQISAAAKLLEICTEHIILKDMVIPHFSDTAILAREYIAANLDSEITIADICEYTHSNRTQLYDVFSREFGIGIAAYIRKKRLEYAYSLLKNEHLNVREASEKSGFGDYNYFSRIFKKEFGFSPHKVKHQ